MKKVILLFLVFVSLFIVSCSSSMRIKGGKLNYTGATGTVANQIQSEDPKDKTSFSSESEKIIEMIIPAGSIIEVPSLVGTTNTQKITIITNIPFKATIKDKVNSSAGGSQKNVLGETIAKLKSMKWISIVGMFLMLFGGASMFWPPLRAVIGSYTTSLVIVAGGVLLLILPVIVVGNETLILAVVLGAVGIYFLAYRYGGTSKETKIWRDLNKNNIVDEGETK